ncbi:hypothetical protein ENSA5_05020 [Enhygromyxa salina]|uniref:VWFA domain-containing protein n=1 Tax=Enhygromyxa salina TaxID=215803 RepID=A0A2S9YHY8_9BACT|nr:hypothetical protein [Enhygromyxa salina]PRQ04737.1 hypothetical protein ENSA5_05020 [Enhygromyxa salina]
MSQVHRSTISRLSIAALLSLSACADPGGDATNTDDAEGVGSEDDTGITTSTDTDDPDGGTKLDLSQETDLPGGEEGGCEKIDFLFVIDSSGSMADNQANLIASFPGLVAAMMDNVEADDWHVMVVDSDGQWSGTDCANACTTLGFCPDAPEFDCQTPPPELCDITIGGGVIAPMGEAASNQDCALASDARYIQSGEPDLLASFSCVAKVGVDGGDTERPMDAMVRALGDELGEPGGCNEGFVRDDAILVITIITDEPDEHSMDEPGTWFDAVVATKADNPDAVVVLGLLPDGDLGMPLCGAEAVAAPRMSAFLDLFEQSSRASVCEPDYSPFFLDAVSVISGACEEFDPVG